jgi:quercetin dioxygenase-like cupin family protein
MISLNSDLPVIPGRPGVSQRKPKHDPAVLGVEEWTFEPGVQFTGHVHDESQITYIVKGRLRLKQGDEEVTLEGGCYYYTPAGTAHEITKIIETTTMVIVSATKQSHREPHDHH